jgi:hypothetical protein
MQTKMLADLEKAVEGWMDKLSDSPEWMGVWYPENLHVMMAKAAALVFDANRAGQEFAQERAKDLE